MVLCVHTLLTCLSQFLPMTEMYSSTFPLFIPVHTLSCHGNVPLSGVSPLSLYAQQFAHPGYTVFRGYSFPILRFLHYARALHLLSPAVYNL